MLQAARKTLPKTASSLPLVGLLGVVFCGLGFALTMRRRQNA
jgi:LPXTG-motif cell wall-anchored protein